MDKKKNWEAPAALQDAPQLVLYNSLTDTKVPFVPSGQLGPRVVTWYTCGPTVYASAHLGHARNYVTFDILRRVLEDHFQYTIRFIMNVTDVDDKIILRARRNHLMEAYRAQQPPFERVLADAREALTQALAKQQAKMSEARAALGAVEASPADQAHKVDGIGGAVVAVVHVSGVAGACCCWFRRCQQWGVMMTRPGC